MPYFIQQLFGSGVYYFAWEGDTTNPFLKHIDSPIQFILEVDDSTSLYIEDIGGYVEPGTPLVIVQGRVYHHLPRITEE